MKFPADPPQLMKTVLRVAVLVDSAQLNLLVARTGVVTIRYAASAIATHSLQATLNLGAFFRFLRYVNMVCSLL